MQDADFNITEMHNNFLWFFIIIVSALSYSASNERPPSTVIV